MGCDWLVRKITIALVGMGAVFSRGLLVKLRDNGITRLMAKVLLKEPRRAPQSKSPPSLNRGGSISSDHRNNSFSVSSTS